MTTTEAPVTGEQKTDWEIAMEAEAERERLADINNNRKSFGNREEIKWHEISTKEPTVGRIIGPPVSHRNSSSDPKQVFISEIVNDRGNKQRVVWPQKKSADGRDLGILDDSFLLYRIYEDVTKGFWKKPYTKGDKKSYEHEGTQSLLWVTNGKSLLKNTIEINFDLKFFPSKSGEFIMNFIPRNTESAEWCRENKHTMLLTRKISTSDKGTKYPKNGITSELYKLIYNKVIQFDRKNGWTLRDVVISKTTADNAGRTEDTYEVQDCIEKLAVAQLRKIPLEYPYDRAVEGPLTEEELAYKTFNLNFHYAPISYGSLLRNFENRIRTVDKELNRRYMELLLDYAQIEKQEKEKKKAEWEAKKNLTHHELSTETGEEAEADKVPF